MFLAAKGANLYYYIFEQPKDRRESKLHDRIRIALEEQRIVGEMVKANPIQPPLDLAKTGLAKGYSTIVMIGSDEMITKSVKTIANAKAALGCVPTNPNSPFYSLLSVHNWDSACSILPTRKIIKVDLCQVGEDHCFLTSVKVISTVADQNKKDTPAKIPIVIDFGHFKARSKVSDIDIHNGLFNLGDSAATRASFQDNRFSVTFCDELSSPEGIWSKFFGTKNKKMAEPKSIFYADRIRISEGRFLVLQNNEVLAKTPVQIQIVPASLNLIVGRLATSIKN